MGTATNQQERLRNAIAGDGDALSALLAESHGRMVRYVQAKIPGDIAGVVGAEDVVQEAHIAAFREIGRFEPRGEDSFERWLRTIALRRLRNAIRFHRQARRGGGAARIVVTPALERSAVMLLDMMQAADRTPSRTAAAGEAATAVSAALEALPDDYRAAVRLVYLEGRTVAEAAAVMRRTERAVHNLCFKARRRLRELLGDRSRFLSALD